MTGQIKTTLAVALVGIAGALPSASAADKCRQVSVAVTPEASETHNLRSTPRHNDPVIDSALAVVGQPVNPVELVGSEDIKKIFARLNAGAPPIGLNAFRPMVGSLEPIYVNRDSALYRTAARRRSALALLQLAATIVHEQVHNSDGEHAAYRVQSDFVRSRVPTLPAREQAEAQRYLRALDSRAYSRGLVERVLRERRSVASAGGQQPADMAGWTADQAVLILQECRTSLIAK